MKTYEKVYNLVKKIPKGKVSTYGHIGEILGINPRVVGWALNRLAKYDEGKGLSRYTPTSSIPWHRVINSKGRISTNKLNNIPLDLQKTLLELDKVKFDENMGIDLKRYLFMIEPTGKTQPSTSREPSKLTVEEY